MKRIARIIADHITPALDVLFYKYSAQIQESVSKEHDLMSTRNTDMVNRVDSAINKIDTMIDRLDTMLARIDTMIARSDARVEAINHMVDNCLEVSKTCANTTEKSEAVVHENSITFRLALEAHKEETAALRLENTNYQLLLKEANSALHTEQKISSDIKHSVRELKDTMDHFVSAASRPDINIHK